MRALYQASPWLAGVAFGVAALALTLGWRSSSGAPPPRADRSGAGAEVRAARQRDFELGVNIPAIVHYGYGDLAPRATVRDTEADLAAVQAMGGNIVRVYVAYDGISAEESARRLGVFLTAAQAHGISVIASLVNYYGSRQNPRGMDSAYGLSWHGIPYLSHDFFASGYKGAYFDFVRTVVSANRAHSNIYAWEPGNELADADRASFLRFMRDTTDLIKSLDPGRPVAAGIMEAAQAGFSPEALYGSLPALDIVTIHPGNGYRGSSVDVDWAVAHGKKAIVEETGISARDNRASRFETELRFWRNKGVSAFLLDGFIAKGLSDDGSGDKALGFDDIWHTDYDQIAAMLQREARSSP